MPELYRQRITNGTPAADGTPILVREYGLYTIVWAAAFMLILHAPEEIHPRT